VNRTVLGENGGLPLAGCPRFRGIMTFSKAPLDFNSHSNFGSNSGDMTGICILIPDRVPREFFTSPKCYEPTKKGSFAQGASRFNKLAAIRRLINDKIQAGMDQVFLLCNV
jgi:hypothetical protein